MFVFVVFLYLLGLVCDCMNGVPMMNDVEHHKERAQSIMLSPPSSCGEKSCRISEDLSHQQDSSKAANPPKRNISQEVYLETPIYKFVVREKDFISKFDSKMMLPFEFLSIDELETLRKLGFGKGLEAFMKELAGLPKYHRIPLSLCIKDLIIITKASFKKRLPDARYHFERANELWQELEMINSIYFAWKGLFDLCNRRRSSQDFRFQVFEKVLSAFDFIEEDGLDVIEMRQHLHQVFITAETSDYVGIYSKKSLLMLTHEFRLRALNPIVNDFCDNFVSNDHPLCMEWSRTNDYRLLQGLRQEADLVLRSLIEEKLMNVLTTLAEPYMANAYFQNWKSMYLPSLEGRSLAYQFGSLEINWSRDSHSFKLSPSHYSSFLDALIYSEVDLLSTLYRNLISDIIENQKSNLSNMSPLDFEKIISFTKFLTWLRNQESKSYLVHKMNFYMNDQYPGIIENKSFGTLLNSHFARYYGLEMSVSIGMDDIFRIRGGVESDKEIRSFYLATIDYFKERLLSRAYSDYWSVISRNNLLKK